MGTHNFKHSKWVLSCCKQAISTTISDPPSYMPYGESTVLGKCQKSTFISLFTISVLQMQFFINPNRFAIYNLYNGLNPIPENSFSAYPSIALWEKEVQNRKNLSVKWIFLKYFFDITTHFLWCFLWQILNLNFFLL